MSYQTNKMKRIKTKYTNILSRDLGVTMSNSPTNVLVICNGGLSNGISGEKVCDIFEKFGNIENVVMLPGKSYCFVKFTDDFSAVKAYDKINGEVVWPEIKGPLYLGFIQDIKPSLLSGFYNFEKPPGLVLIEDFITEEEEKLILNLVDMESAENTSELKHRKVKHYGYEFKYTTNNVDLSEPIEEIPNDFNFLWERLKEKGGHVQFTPDQLTINCYEPGQGIPHHVDTHSPFEDGILSLSLLSSIVMEFKNPNGVCLNVFLPRRSLCIMLGESRYDWTHGITPRKSDVVLKKAGFFTVQNREKRISLTFRKTREGDCQCKYPKLCDTFMKKMTREAVSDMRNVHLGKVASELEGSYVHKVYDKIASHFSETRHKPWPNVSKFINSFETGSILIDVGCGNGKYFTKQSTRYEIGCDSSNGLLQVCKNQGFECFSCNCLNIPVRDNTADGCICIAVIHHLTTEERRLRAIKEIIRILKPKGRALIYVWAKNQERENKSSYLKQCTKSEKKRHQEPELQKVTVKTIEKDIFLPVHVNRTNFNHSDLLVPWKLKRNESGTGLDDDRVYLRFYHVYEEDELENTCRSLESINISDYYYDQGNWCIVLEKK